jgi:PAS domain S-box-containing protein
MNQEQNDRSQPISSSGPGSRLPPTLGRNSAIEQALGSGFPLLRKLIDLLPDYIFVKDTQSRFVLNNLAHARILGASQPDELVGKTDSDCFPPELAQKFLTDEQTLLTTGQPVDREETVIDPATGAIQWLRTTKVILRSDEGSILGLVGISRDITELKLAEEALRKAHDDLEQRVLERTAELSAKSADLAEANATLQKEMAERERISQAFSRERNMLRTLIDNLPDYIFVKDRHSRFVLINQACARQLGVVHPDEVMGKSDADFAPPDLANQYLADEQALMDSGQPVHKEEPTWHQQSGKMGCSLTTKVPLKDEEGQIIGLVGIGRDITSIKLADQRLEMLHKELLDVTRQAGMAEIATSVLHNVGNALNSVNVSATLVADGLRKSRIASVAKLAALLNEHADDLGRFVAEDEKGRQIPAFVSKLAEHLEMERSHLIEELAALSKNVAHIKEIISVQQNYAKVSGLVQTLSVTELVDDALRMNAEAYTRHKIKVARDYANPPPVEMDKHRTLQILLNLFQNAKRACDDSGRPDKQVTVRIRLQEAASVQIEVADNGIGITPEDLTRIFSHGFTTRKDGHGFGLHSGSLAAKEMGGTLTAHSDGLGKGAVFILELPLHPPPAQNPRATKTEDNTVPAGNAD